MWAWTSLGIMLGMEIQTVIWPVWLLMWFHFFQTVALSMWPLIVCVNSWLSDRCQCLSNDKCFYFFPLWIANELFWRKCKFKMWKWNTLNSRWMTRISMRKKIAILKGRNMNGLTAIEEYGELFLLLSIILPKRGIAEYIFPLLCG